MRPFRTILVVPLIAVLALGSACGTSASPSPAAPTPTGSNAALHDVLPASIKAAGVIHFAGDSHPPYRVVGADGKTVTGIDVDLQAALGKVLGVRTDITIVDGLPTALTGMQSGRFDAFNGPVKDTADREKTFDSIVWMVTRTAYLVPTGSTAGITTSADLCGKKVAGVAGSITEDQAKKLTAWCATQGKPAVTFIGLADTNAIILAAKSGRADAAAMTQTAAIDAQSKEKGAFTYVTQSDEQGAGVDQLALLAPRSSGLGPVLFQAFKELFANGDYARIMAKYGQDRVAIAAPIFNPSATS